VSISDGLMHVADLRIADVNGVPAIGFNRLQFSLEINIHATRGRTVEMGSLTGFVYAGTSPAGALKPLGIAVAETNWFASTADDPRRQFLSLYLDLSGEQLAALERVRGGGSLTFQFDVRMLVRSIERNVQLGFETLRFEANLSVWSKVLKQLGYLELLLLSVELPIDDVPAELRNAVSQVRAAHEDLIAGRYDSTVGRCRIAMDAIDAVVKPESTLGQTIQSLSANRETLTGMTKRARGDLVRMVLRHYTHLAHHVDSGGGPESFSRHDALFILTATAGVIWDAVGELQRRS
jgi:hypothetical protein